MYRRDRTTWDQQHTGRRRAPVAHPGEWQPEPLHLPLHVPDAPANGPEPEAEQRPGVVIIDPDDYPDLL